MLIAACLALALGTQTPSPTARTWYGPQVATFHVQYAGNPYDPAENDVHIHFIDGAGKIEDRIAYLDDGQWKAVLVSERAGKYRPVLVRNGVESTEPSDPPIVELTDALPNGFLRVDRLNPTRFAWDSGKPYYPIGFNLPWQAKDMPPMLDQMQKMGENGLNWTRIWADNWDGKNPWWPGQDPGEPDNLWAPALAKWEQLILGCQQNGLAFQMVLFNHGAFSMTIDPNWPDHPWNKAKGGFLDSPIAFFTDAEAKHRTKMWLRYAVARYAASPQLMAWELFNEVENTDGFKDDPKKVEDWGAEMAAYLRSIDPYSHLITTSAIASPGPWVDYYQRHTYALDLEKSISAAALPGDKPFFFGEFGPSPSGVRAPSERAVVREGLCASIFSGQSGAAQYWFWDRVEKEDMYPEFKAAAAVIRLSDRANHLKALPLGVKATAAGGAARVTAVGDLSWLLVRVSLPAAASMEGVTLADLGLAAGAYTLSVVDLKTGEATTGEATVEGIAHTERLTLPSRDCVVIIKAHGSP